MCWGEMRERLEELNRRTQPRSLKKEDLGEAVGARDSKLPKWQQVSPGTPTERVASFCWAIVVIRPGRLWLVRNLFTEGNGRLHEN
jgi:hypothetical protein